MTVRVKEPRVQFWTLDEHETLESATAWFANNLPVYEPKQLNEDGSLVAVDLSLVEPETYTFDKGTVFQGETTYVLTQ